MSDPTTPKGRRQPEGEHLQAFSRRRSLPALADVLKDLAEASEEAERVRSKIFAIGGPSPLWGQAASVAIKLRWVRRDIATAIEEEPEGNDQTHGAPLTDGASS